jgi:hypothetical protein
VSRARLRRILWIGAAALLVAAALVAIAALLRGEFSDTDADVLVTLGATFLCGTTGLAGLALGERRPRLGPAVALLAPVELALLVLPMWQGDPSDTTVRLALTSLVATIAQLAAVTQLLLLRGTRLLWLAALTWLAIGGASVLTIGGIWTSPDSDGFVKTVAVLWILAALGCLLLPVLQRLTAAGEAARDDRVLASLDDVELVATRTGGGVAVEPRLAPGERLVLRRRG